MNITQLSEQLKDVPQNRLIDYAKNPNSVVPQFLALAEIQRRQQLSAPIQAPQSTVANDVLAQAQPAPMMPQGMPVAPQGMPAMQARPNPQQMAQQLPENQPGVTQMPANIAKEGFAAGGIVAFADGGSAEEEDDREMSTLFPRQSMANFEDMLSAIPGGIRGLIDKIPKSYDETKRTQEAAQTSAKGSHKYESAVLEEAKRQGVDPSLALHVLYKETGNLKDPETARSKAGAMGVMQLMPKTAAGLGVNPEDAMDNIRGGVTYLRQMADKYKDNRLAAAAYNAGPGNVDKALKRQGGLDTLPHETRNYIAGLAKGGVVERFDEGGTAKERQAAALDALNIGMPSAYDDYKDGIPMSQSDYYHQRAMAEAAIKRNIPIPATMSPEQLKVYQSVYGKTPSVTSVPASAAADTSKSDAVVSKRDSATENVQSPDRTYISKEQMGPPPSYAPRDYVDATAPQAPVAKTRSEMYADALEKDIEAQAKKAAESGDKDLAMSIMQAGFKMMAGKSPYFFSNVGEGGEQGVSTYAALQKQGADREKDVMNARLGLYKYGAAEEGAKETREANALYRQAMIDQKVAGAANQQYEFGQKQIALARDDVRQYEQMRIKQIENKYTKNPLFGTDPKLKAAYDAEIASIYNDPQYQALFRLGYPNLPTSGQTAGTGPVKTYDPKTGTVK